MGWTQCAGAGPACRLRSHTLTSLYFLQVQVREVTRSMVHLVLLLSQPCALRWLVTVQVLCFPHHRRCLR